MTTIKQENYILATDLIDAMIRRQKVIFDQFLSTIFGESVQPIKHKFTAPAMGRDLEIIRREIWVRFYHNPNYIRMLEAIESDSELNSLKAQFNAIQWRVNQPKKDLVSALAVSMERLITPALDRLVNFMKNKEDTSKSVFTPV